MPIKTGRLLRISAAALALTGGAVAAAQSDLTVALQLEPRI